MKAKKTRIHRRGRPRLKRRRNIIEIKVFLLRKGINQREIARVTGAHFVNVAKTINGYKNDKKTLDYLLSIGCPARILGVA